MNVGAASILLCTYNRAALLRDTLAALQAMTPVSDCRSEIIVVDNNSNDDTAQVVAQSAQRGPIPVVYLREPSQGKSFALNNGLAHVRGDVIALTDDDVLPGADWLGRIVANFRRHDVSFVFGKVLPRWGATPPPELLLPKAQDIWGPLALVDYGDTPAVYSPENTGQRLPIGANLALVASAVRAIGGWRTDLGKVNNTLISGEDHEIFVRLRRLGLYSGYYDPELTVRHFVPASRLRRQYFREWFFWHGKTQALMLSELYPDIDLACVPRIAGTPRFFYRQAFHRVGRWLGAAARRDSLGRFIEELAVMEFAGLLSGCWNRRLPTAVARPGMDELSRTGTASDTHP